MTVGLADGARLNWAWLTEKTDLQMLDFYHLSEYGKLAASALFPERKGASLETRNSNAAEKAASVTDTLHRLKHRKTAPAAVIKELGAEIESLRMQLDGVTKSGKKADEERIGTLEKVRTYMANQRSRMNYHYRLKVISPFGSGGSGCVEGGCKLIIKDRLCRTGVRWTKEGAASVIALRCLVKTEGALGRFLGDAHGRGHEAGCRLAKAGTKERHLLTKRQIIGRQAKHYPQGRLDIKLASDQMWANDALETSNGLSVP
jgi:hypothetical protein